MVDRNAGRIVITLTSKGAKDLRKDLEALGPAGKRSLATLDRALKKTPAGAKALDESVKELSRSLDDLAGRAGPAGRVLGSLGPIGKAAAIGIGAIALAGTAALKMARDAVRDFDAMAKAADDLAVHTDTFQALKFAALEQGVAMEQAEAALRQFTRASAEASQGRGELTEKLKTSHPELLKTIQLEETMEGKLNAVSKALKNATSEQEKTLISTAAFGENGRAMIRVLGESETAIEDLTARAREMGIVIDESVLRNAEEMENKLGVAATVIDVNLKKAFIELAPVIVDAAELLVDVAKAINRIVDSIRKLENKTQAGLERSLVDTQDNLTNEVKNYRRQLDVMFADIEATEAARAAGTLKAGEFLVNGRKQDNVFLKTIEGRIQELKDKESKTQALLEDRKSVSEAGTVGGSGSGTSDPGLTASEQAKLQSIVDQAQIKATSSAEKLKLTLQALDDARKAGLISSDEELNRLKQAERAYAGRADANRRATEAARERAEADRLVAQLTEAALSPQERYNQALAELNSVQERLSGSTYAARLAEITAERDKSVAKLAEEARLTAAAANVQQALAQVTAGIVDPQKRYNAALEELRKLKPHLTDDAYRAQLEKEKQALDAATEAAKKLDDVRQSIKTDAQRQQDEINDLNKLRQSATNPKGLSAAEYAKAVANIQKKYQGLNQTSQQHIDLMGVLNGVISGQISSWDDLGQVALKVLAQIATQALTTQNSIGGIGQVLGGLFGGGGGGVSFGGGFGGGTVSSGGGGLLGGLFGGGSGGGSGSGGFGLLAGALGLGAGLLFGKKRGGSSAPAGPGFVGATTGGAVPVGAGAAPIPSAPPPPASVIIQNYGPPAEASTREQLGSNNEREIVIQMREIGKQTTLETLGDGSADTVLAQNYGVHRQPGSR